MAKWWTKVFPKVEDRTGMLSVDQYLKLVTEYGINRQARGFREDAEGPSTDWDFYAERLYKASGVVYMVAQARSKVFAEARFKWQRIDEPNSPFNLFGSKGLTILEEPWPNGSTGDLLTRAIQDVDLGGNFFAVRELGAHKRPRIRRLRPDWVYVVLSAPPEEATRSDVVGYEYHPGGYGSGAKPEYFSVEEVAHWAPEPDPSFHYRGMSWLTPVVNEILTEQDAQQHRRNFFVRGAQLGVAVMVNKDQVTAEQMAKFKDEFLSKHQSARNAHEPLFLGPGADVKIIEADPSSWDTRSISGLSETHIAGAAGVPPVVAGLSEGLSGSSLNSGNYKVAAQGFVERTIRPLWRSFCDAMQPLVEEPTRRKGTGGPVRLTVDEREVSVLNDDRQKDAEVLATYAKTINGLIAMGYTPESCRDLIVTSNPAVLVHSGLVSVQLYKPGDDPAASDEGSTPADDNGGFPTGPAEPEQEEPEDPSHDPVTPKGGNKT